tara:strand:- start:107 stop:679 length:573 start_codon:yes stop_codon:yes gene_type:complete
MKNININFTDEFMKEMENSIPDKILQKKLNTWTFHKNGSGVRFDDNLLTSFYLYASKNPKHNDKEKELLLFKLNYTDDGIKFKNIYIEGEEIENYRYEYRYDSEMNLVSKYKFYLDDKNDIFCNKFEEENNLVNLNYVRGKEPRDFTEFINFLENNNIAINEGELNECNYFLKENNNTVYLILGNYELND